MSRQDPDQVVAALARDGFGLRLENFELCCLAGLHLTARHTARASFAEEELLGLFRQVCEQVNPGAENPRRSAANAVQRLRDQRMLARVDGAGLVRAGDYSLTGLATAIVEYLLADEALTRESLTLLTGTLLGKLAQIKAAAAQARTDQEWDEQVIGPLRVTVSDLVRGIERRQRGLDVAQEQVQAQIAGLLESDWLDAIESAQQLLDGMTEKLNELSQVLMGHSQQLQALLQDVHDSAEAADATDAQQMAQRVMEQLDGVGEWGQARNQAWSTYYRRVVRYLRDVVRLDPDRALSQRLRDQLSGWLARPFHLTVCKARPLRVHRRPALRTERPPVHRPARPRDKSPPVETPTRDVDLDQLVADAIARGHHTLAGVTAHVLPQLNAPDRFVAAGRIAHILGQRGVDSALTRPWRHVADLEIEDWELRL